ncbi:MAG: HlyD family efflux transporter periplasmic adaptor subunit [Rhodospirillales bacterium]|nr:HlyD family efflux transporter periplasmic adaptor subunit [Rhodospirillales bacterium]
MARAKKFRWGAVGLAILVAVAGIGLWVMPSRQTSSAQDTGKPAQPPLIARGYTDAPEGTAVVAGDPAGGSVLVELRVKDGQKVKKGEVLAVLSNYGRADVTLRMAEADLVKLKQQYDFILKGTRVTEIALQEASLKSSIEQNKLDALQRARSGKPPDVREIETSIADQALERQKARLALMKTTLDNDTAQYEIDIANTQSRVDSAKRTLEDALVRSPLDGVVVQIFSRQGERVSPAGIVKVVDMNQLRVLADVDELHVGRLKPGGKVDVTFRGNNDVYKGTIERIAPTVKRMQRVEPDGGSSTDARVVQVEIKIDDSSSMPPVLGRETRVTFL